MAAFPAFVDAHAAHALASARGAPGPFSEAVQTACIEAAKRAVQHFAPRARAGDSGAAEAHGAVARACLLAALERVAVHWLDGVLMFGVDGERPWLTVELAWRTAAELAGAAGVPLPPGHPHGEHGAGCRSVQLATPRICVARLGAVRAAEAAVRGLAEATQHKRPRDDDDDCDARQRRRS